MKRLVQYFRETKSDKAVLWYYLIWYVTTVYFYFDSSIRLWIDAIGISAVIGTGLLLSVSSGKVGRDKWQTFRLYLMPFCVSSLSALIKGQGSIVFISPKIEEAFLSAARCVLFLALLDDGMILQNFE